ncbi:MAG: putative flavoprotein involved in K+ transport [Bacteroidetes bacterium HLUCCA01]|nr:MAG: putative flavoprotein involved in K+ transport [Bacteroidetes bacterium HLUCCA01]
MLHLNHQYLGSHVRNCPGWTIIGGGIHGVLLARHLLDTQVATPETLRILDPNPRLLHNWKRMTARIGMTHLRSPMVHHLDGDPFSLRNFVNRFKNCDVAMQQNDVKPFIEPNNRPSLALFNAHCDEIVHEYDLQSLHEQTSVCKVAHRQENADWWVHHTHGTLTADNVVLAMGRAPALKPNWAEHAELHGVMVDHVLGEYTNTDHFQSGSTLLVTGGGLTAGQTALMLIDRGFKVIMASRHSIRSEAYDSDPGWMGPKYLNRFWRSSYGVRRSMIRKARNRGTVTPEIFLQLRAAQTIGKLSIVRASVSAMDVVTPELMIVRFSDGSQQVIGGILLATGLETTRPGGNLVDDLIRELTLPLGRCGFPTPGATLEWAPGLYVSGALAELELGPTAPNISGARMAAERIVLHERQKAMRLKQECDPSGQVRTAYAV